MKLTVLMDNNTYIDRYYKGEPAVSYYLEDGYRNILFDTITLLVKAIFEYLELGLQRYGL